MTRLVALRAPGQMAPTNGEAKESAHELAHYRGSPVLTSS